MTSVAAPNPRAAALRKLQMQFLPEAAAFAFVALMTAQVSEVGPLLVLAQLGIFGLLVVMRPADCLRIFLRWWPLLLTPLIAFASFFWSDLPAQSARYGFQLFFTAFVGVLLANMLPPHRFIAMTFLSMLVFCILSVASRRMGPSVEGLVLVGFTGSKNQMALAAYTLLVSGVATFLLRESPRWMRPAALFGGLVAVYILATTSSASAFLLAGLAAPGLIALHLTKRMAPAVRVAILGFAIIVAIPIIFLAPEIEAAINYFLFDTLGKDPTLTGRTHLWAHAVDLISRRPIEGYGYQAFWLGESPESVGLLRWAGVADGRTFHFHNTYLQLGVDIGYLGMVTFAGAILAGLFAGMRQYILHPTTATAWAFVMFLGIAVLSFTELVLAPMLPRTLFLYACVVYLFWSPQPAAQPAPRRVYRKTWAAG
ncbi:lipid A core-O-antigen ligase and related enzymes [alpha proteobacterium U9-1i]|nr:lipid A core-O-antigen ligase and related enzymes [alpha proteobacterium U9-1i]